MLTTKSILDVGRIIFGDIELIIIIFIEGIMNNPNVAFIQELTPASIRTLTQA
jgi:hypothetical protein